MSINFQGKDLGTMPDPDASSPLDLAKEKAMAIHFQGSKLKMAPAEEDTQSPMRLQGNAQCNVHGYKQRAAALNQRVKGIVLDNNKDGKISVDEFDVRSQIQKVRVGEDTAVGLELAEVKKKLQETETKFVAYQQAVVESQEAKDIAQQRASQEVANLRSQLESFQAMMKMDSECSSASQALLQEENEALKKRLHKAENEVDALRVQLMFVIKELADGMDQRNEEVSLLQRQIRTAIVCGNALIEPQQDEGASGREEAEKYLSALGRESGLGADIGAIEEQDFPLDSEMYKARQQWLRSIVEEMGKQVTMRTAHTDYQRAKSEAGVARART